jgi:outer membrane protein assembly factor BamB
VAAKGRGYGGWFVAAILVVIFLVSTNTWNPFPDLWNWANTSRELSDPPPSWQQRLGARPDSVAQAGNTLVIEADTSVEGRRISDGSQIWSRKADWAAVAGEGAGAVTVVGKLLVKGYDVIDPANGYRLRHVDDVVGVWTYRDAILDVHCRRPKECVLTARTPRTGERLWEVELPGVGFVLFADNPKLQGTRPLTTSRVADRPDGAQPMPRVLGFPIDHDVYLVDTAVGRVLPEVKPDRREQVVVAGGRVLRIAATPADGACYFAVEARDAVTGDQVWREAGVNLRTTSGSGCQQGRPPSGAGNVVIGVAPDGREAVLDANDGRAVWVGKEGEKVLAVDNRYALVRSADGKLVLGMRLGREEPLWTREVNSGAEAALTGCAALVVDRKPNRIIAIDPASGVERLNVRSDAKVLACGRDGLVLSDVRELGYLRFGATAGGDNPARPGRTPTGPVPTGPTEAGVEPPGPGKDG